MHKYKISFYRGYMMFTVLILEDDKEQQKAIAKIINEHYENWQLYNATTYKEACNLIETKTFDLFFAGY